MLLNFIFICTTGVVGVEVMIFNFNKSINFIFRLSVYNLCPSVVIIFLFFFFEVVIFTGLLEINIDVAGVADSHEVKVKL